MTSHADGTSPLNPDFIAARGFLAIRVRMILTEILREKGSLVDVGPSGMRIDDWTYALLGRENIEKDGTSLTELRCPTCASELVVHEVYEQSVGERGGIVILGDAVCSTGPEEHGAYLVGMPGTAMEALAHLDTYATRLDRRIATGGMSNFEQQEYVDLVGLLALTVEEGDE